MSNQPELSFIVPFEHPSLPGHFPGRPVVPGVVLLDAVFERIGRVAQLASVRFTGPVLPGQRVELGFKAAGGQVDFRGHVEGRLVFRGRARLAAGQP